MLKSLYSGVSGLQSHQVAMDVESNNIANVNTTGYKYSRANFSDLLAQTSSIATAPQGALGGKNAVQIGLGSTVSSQTRIFSQGSIQNSDKNTDVAIQGDGFFIISPDGGNTYKYTRAGDFKFDAAGNFVDNNGFITQGWIRDAVTGKVDSTGPIKNISIAPGLTTPASPTSEVVLKANLNSGILVDVNSISPAYAVESGTPPSMSVPPVFSGDALDAAGAPIASGDLGVMFNDSGEAFSLQTNQGVWVSFLSAETTGANGVAAGAASLDITFTLDDGSTKQVQAAAGAVGDTAAQNGGRFAAAINAQSSITGVNAVYNASTNQIALVNDNSNSDASHNINVSAVGNTNSGLSVANQSTTAYKYQYSPNGAIALADDNKTFTTISDLRYAMEIQARAVEVITPATSGPYLAGAGTGLNEAADFTINGQAIHVNDGGQTTENSVVTFGPLAAGQTLTLGGLTLTATTSMTNIEVADAFDNIADGDSAAVIPIPPNGIFTGTLTGWSTDNNLLDNKTTFTSSTLITDVADLVIAGTGSLSSSLLKTEGKGATTPDENGAIYAAAINNAGIAGITAKYVSGTGLTISNTNKIAVDLVVAVAGDEGLTGFPGGPSTTTILPGTIGNGDAILNESNIEIKVNEQGKFEITNPGLSNDGDYDMNLKITALKDKTAGITENIRFTTSMMALNAVLPAGTTGSAFSQSFNAATHSSSIDIFDSLGSKHTVRMELRKTALDATTGSTWDMKISVPEPGSIDTIAPVNEKTGSVRFNNDGSLATYSPQNISFSGNNGSAPNQQVRILFGNTNGFDGVTSFDAASSTSGISQDGYTGGDLVGIRIDQSGTVVGSFSNGRSFGLAQIAMAKFTNNEGLATEGGNVYIQTANSGDPIIGSAATSGRGFIQSSALEASNVDLSRALTQLIIIQRGYQANGKTITTSDQLLQTLIGLKN